MDCDRAYAISNVDSERVIITIIIGRIYIIILFRGRFFHFVQPNHDFLEWMCPRGTREQIDEQFWIANADRKCHSDGPSSRMMLFFIVVYFVLGCEIS